MSNPKLFLILLVALLVANNSQAQQTATYQLTFESEWSGSTHPSAFPSGAHFSGLIGTTHNSSISYWAVGQPASAGVKQMAETGSKAGLISIFNSSDDGGSSDKRINQGGLSTSPASITFTFSVSTMHPLLTLVSMIAPSPDWFVGVSGLPLRTQNGWVNSLSVDLFAFDAGTDSGSSYTAADQATQPPSTISALIEPPFRVNGVVPRMGRFVLSLLSVTALEEAEVVPASFGISNAYPNPFSTDVTIEYDLSQGGDLQIDVYDLQGRLVETLFRGEANRGKHEIRWSPYNVRSGAYIVRLQSNNQSAFRTVNLVK